MDTHLSTLNQPIDIYHSDLCATLSVRRRCKECFKKYKAEKSMSYRKQEAEKIIKTRSVVISSKPKYANVFCINCEGKSIKDICGECKTRYKSAAMAAYRLNKKKQKTNYVQPECDLQLTQNKDNCGVVSNVPQKLESELGSTSMCNGIKKRKIQSCNELNSNSMCNKKQKVKHVQNKQKEYSSVLNSVQQSNHTNRPNSSERPIATHDKVNAEEKENLMCANLSNLNNVTTPKKILCEKTLRNNKVKLNKVLGKSHNEKIQKMNYYLKNSPLSEQKSYIKTLIPNHNEQHNGNLYQALRKETEEF